MYIVYALKSKKRQYIYVGLTNNIIRRFHEHNRGYNKTTKPYAPFIIVFSQKYPTRVEARKREKFLKSGVGKEFLKNHVVK